MASVDVKAAFPNTPHRLIEEVWRQLGLPYGDFLEKYLRSRTYTVTTGKGCTEWVTPGSGVPQGGVEGPFLYLLAMLPLMSWIARKICNWRGQHTRRQRRRMWMMRYPWHGMKNPNRWGTT